VKDSASRRRRGTGAVGGAASAAPGAVGGASAGAVGGAGDAVAAAAGDGMTLARSLLLLPCVAGAGRA